MLKRTFLLALAIACTSLAWGQTPAAPVTRVVMLGTGTPNPDPEHSGPAVAVVVKGQAYLVDFGPGVVRRAAQAYQNGIAELQPAKLTIVFSTHLHSDHTAGLSDLYLTPAVVGRRVPLELYGPAGLADMAHHIREAYAKDFKVRTEGDERESPAPYDIHVHEIKPGVVYKDGNVTVTAFPVKHGSWDQAFGYRFDAAGRSIVISGDTIPADSVVQACNGCDVLVHEVYSMRGYAEHTPQHQKYYREFHTSSQELAGIASRANPKLLVLYHQLKGKARDAELVQEIHAAGFNGQIVSAVDLGVY